MGHSKFNSCEKLNAMQITQLLVSRELLSFPTVSSPEFYFIPRSGHWVNNLRSKRLLFFGFFFWFVVVVVVFFFGAAS